MQGNNDEDQDYKGYPPPQLTRQFAYYEDMEQPPRKISTQISSIKPQQTKRNYPIVYRRPF